MQLYVDLSWTKDSQPFLRCLSVVLLYSVICPISLYSRLEGTESDFRLEECLWLLVLHYRFWLISTWLFGNDRAISVVWNVNIIAFVNFQCVVRDSLWKARYQNCQRLVVSTFRFISIILLPFNIIVNADYFTAVTRSLALSIWTMQLSSTPSPWTTSPSFCPIRGRTPW